MTGMVESAIFASEFEAHPVDAWPVREDVFTDEDQGAAETGETDVDEYAWAGTETGPEEGGLAEDETWSDEATWSDEGAWSDERTWNEEFFEEQPLETGENSGIDEEPWADEEEFGEEEDEEESGEEESENDLAGPGTTETEAFPSGLALTPVAGPVEKNQEHWDPNDTGIVLYATGADVRKKKLSPNFTVGELVTSGGTAADKARISPLLVACLQSIRDRAGRPVIITSGYRSWARNVAVYRRRGKEPTRSRHCSGQAADIRIPGLTGMQIAKLAVDSCGNLIGIGIGGTSAHIDVRGVSATWTYFRGAANRNALAEIAQYRRHRGAPAPAPKPPVDGTDRAAGRVIRGSFRACTGRAQPGAEAMARQWNRLTGRRAGIYNCRSTTSGSPSLHGEGRSIDLYARVDVPAQKTEADTYVAWLQQNAVELQVAYIIWNRRQWNWQSRARGWRPYPGSNPHTDHIHVDLSREGARTPSALFAGPVPGLGSTQEAESPADDEAPGAACCGLRGDEPKFRIGGFATPDGVAEPRSTPDPRVYGIHLWDYRVNDYSLRPRHRDALRKLVDRIAADVRSGRFADANWRVTIDGFASRTGSEQHNLNLSWWRMNTVARCLECLVVQAGLPPGRVVLGDQRGLGYENAIPDVEDPRRRLVQVTVHPPSMAPPRPKPLSDRFRICFTSLDNKVRTLPIPGLHGMFGIASTTATYRIEDVRTRESQEYTFSGRGAAFQVPLNKVVPARVRDKIPKPVLDMITKLLGRTVPGGGRPGTGACTPFGVHVFPTADPRRNPPPVITVRSFGGPVDLVVPHPALGSVQIGFRNTIFRLHAKALVKPDPLEVDVRRTLAPRVVVGVQGTATPVVRSREAADEEQPPLAWLEYALD